MKRRSTQKTLYYNVYSTYRPPKTTSNSSGSDSELYVNSLMYRYTFTSRVTLVAAFMLCTSLLMHPVANAYAQEPVPETVSTVPSTTEVVSINTSADDEVVEVPDDVQEDVQSDTTIETEEILNTTDESNLADSSAVATTTELFENEQTTTGEVVSSSTATTTSQTGEEPASQSGTGEAGDDVDSTESGVETDSNSATSDDAQPQPDLQPTDNTGITTDEVNVQGVVQEITVMNSDQAIAFNRNECTEVADGSFYCQKMNLDDLPDDALFAAPDSTGDMEIYVVQNGVESKLTDNELEDASPYFDSRSNTIVWHRLINDRYQIMSYDIDSGKEVQLTNTRVNNMEPTRSGDYTVWQRWVTNNWEIVLFDGETEMQLTTSQKHDIAPHIHGDMIIWNVRSNDGTQSLMTYEISTENFNLIADTEGVSVVNPRMLVTYEARYQNGDSVMKGFDLITGEVVPLEHLPRELPTELPKPDATGETRALPTSLQDEDDLEQQDSKPVGDEPPTPTASSTPVVSTTTVEVSADLDLRPTSTPVAIASDLVVQQATIPDVVIPAFEKTTAKATASSTQDS